ncbi:MAG: serine/threonine-protein kinase [Myxococcota bacterium]
MEPDKRELPAFIGRYEIEGHEAEGGMGNVYIARDPRVKRRVAVKLLKELFSGDPAVRRRFEQEAEAVAGLEHEAIVPVYDFGDHEGMLYIVMRYVGGGTLRDRIKGEGKLRLRDVAMVIDRVAAALSAAHASELVHRDIKPANILFDEREVPYLSDFGVAKAPESIEETGSMMLGTPQYLSPEQAIGGEVDSRSDVYSLGVVAYHALAGRPPFEAKTPMAMAMAHAMKEPPKIREFVPELPKVADDVFDKVLAKDREDRYQSAEHFARDLRDIASGRWYLVKLSNRLGISEDIARRPTPIATPDVNFKRRERQRTMPYRPRQVENTLPDTSLRDFADLDDDDDDDDETQML